MTRFDDHLQELREGADRALAGLFELSEGERGSDAETLDRLERTLGYVRLVLEGTEGDLLSEATWQAIREQLNWIAGNPAEAVANAHARGDALIDAVSRLPASRGNDVAQAARKAAADYQRSVQQRLQAVVGKIESVQVKVGEVDAAVDASAVAIESRLAEVAEGFRAKIAEHDTAIANERSLIDNAKTTQAETFREAQTQRDETFRTALTNAEADLTGLLEDSAAVVAERVAEIRRMEAESAALVGAIGLAGTAERYGEEVAEQRKAADFWRWTTVVFVVLAVAALVVIVLSFGGNLQWEEVAGKLSVSLLFGGIATYTARQSARHRQREEHARALQLELTAFGPFIEPLIPEQREEERVIMTRKTFGKVSAASLTAGEERGLAPVSALLSALLSRKEKEGT